MAPDEEIKQQKQQILDFIKAHPGCDALDISFNLQLDTGLVYVLLAALISKKKIEFKNGQMTVKE